MEPPSVMDSGYEESFYTDTNNITRKTEQFDTDPNITKHHEELLDNAETSLSQLGDKESEDSRKVT